jgi:hypothetical protein
VARVPYTGACRKYIASSTFRNILGIALVDKFDDPNARCLGTLKIENRKPEGTNFGAYDEEVCKAFVSKQIVPTLRRLAPPLVAGVDLLVERFGSPREIKDKKEAREWFEEVMRGSSTMRGIKDKDLMEYLQIPRATFYRWKKELSL